MLARNLCRLSLVLLVAACGCVPQDGSLRIWAASDMMHLTDRTPASQTNAVWDSTDQTVTLFSAANETVSFQIVIDTDAVDSVDVAMGPLTGPARRRLGGESVKLFLMKPVTVESFPAWYVRLADEPVEPARFYDALIPVAGSAGTFELKRDKRLARWVDVSVPRDAAPGASRIIMSTSEKGASSARP